VIVTVTVTVTASTHCCEFLLNFSHHFNTFYTHPITECVSTMTTTTAASSSSTSDTDTDTDTSTSGNPYPSVVKININDPAALRHTLDEQSVAYILEQDGILEDHRVSNYKLIIGFSAVAVAFLAQFYPTDSQHYKDVIIGCVIVYTILQIALGCVSFLRDDSNSIVVSKATAERPHPYAATSSMKRYDTAYTLYFDLQSRPHNDRLHKVIDATEYFDVNGLFLREKFQNNLKPFLQEVLSSSKSESASESKKTS
jgi:hypothetical protein